MEKMVLRLITLAALLLSHPAFALSQIVASVDRNPVLANESFVLEIVADDHLNRDAIDTSVLLKHFIVGQTNVSKSTQSINFKTTRTTRWKTTLIARKPGTYLIPSFTAQGISSRPIQITVVAAQTGATEQRDVFLKSDLEPQRIYPGQSAVMTSKIYVAANLENGSFTPPESEGVSFKEMGEAQEKVEIVNGRRYRVFINRFLVSADETGQYTVRPPMFNGSIITQRSRSFFEADRTRRVTAVDDDLELEVMAIPANAPQPFIPAEYITLKEQAELPEQITVGEPITRTIAMVATGVKEELLPAIPYTYPDTLNIYPDKVDINTNYQGASVFASRIETAALIATQPGTLTLPEIKVTYWDTRYHQQAEAVLPARTIQVIAAAKEAPQAKEPELTSSPQVTTVTTPGYWLWISAALATFWIWSLLGWWLHVRAIKQRVTVQPTQAPAKKQKQTDHWQKLMQALADYPNSDLSKPLSAWLQESFGVHSLEQLPQAEMAQQAYQALQAARFSATPEQASIEPFKQALTQLKQAQLKQPAQGASFRLYQS